MTQIEALQKLHSEELEILKVIAEVCEANKITWFLDSGTALGAARHKGFIPWDDDIDIGMMRQDYDRFVHHAHKWLPSGYSLHTFENTAGQSALFAKVCRDNTLFETKETSEAGCEQSIFVDVFAYDALASDASQRRKQLANAHLWQYISYLYHSGDIVVPHKSMLGLVERLACRVMHRVLNLLVDRSDILVRFNRSIMREGEGVSEEYTILSWAGMDPCPRDMLIPCGRATFCDMEFPVPRRLDSYLENMYGDWRKLPAPEERRTHLPQRLLFSDGTSWQVVAGDAG